MIPELFLSQMLLIKTTLVTDPYDPQVVVQGS